MNLAYFFHKDEESWRWIKRMRNHVYHAWSVLLNPSSVPLQYAWSVLLNPSSAPLQPCLYWPPSLLEVLMPSHCSKGSKTKLLSTYFIHFIQSSFFIVEFISLTLEFNLQKAKSLSSINFHPIYSNKIFFQLELPFPPALYQTALRIIDHDGTW